MKTWQGVLDTPKFPERLSAHVIQPGDDPRMHGYAVMGDLARNVGFLDMAWLAVLGELPSPAERDACSHALAWLSPLHVGEGPTHAAVLARTAGTPDEIVPAIAVAALGQLAAMELRALAPFFRWLDEPMGATVPEVAVEAHPSAAYRALYAELVDRSDRWFGAARSLPRDVCLGRVAAAYGLLHRLGARNDLQRHAFATWARLPAALGEALHVQPGAVMTYPIDLPPFRYVEDDPS